jgi:hypothetical protein
MMRIYFYYFYLMEGLVLYGEKKACCKSCAKGKQCDSNKMDTDSHHEKEDYYDVDYYDCVQKKKKGRLLRAMLDPKVDCDIQFPNGYVIPKSIGINKTNSISLTTNGQKSLWTQVNFGQYLIEGGSFFAGDATAHPRSNFFYSNPGAAETFNGTTRLAINQYKGSDICLVKDYFNSIRPGPIKIRIDYVGRSDAASGNIYIGISHSFATPPTGETAVPAKTIENGFLADLNYTSVKAIEDCPVSFVGSATNSYEIYYVPHDLRTNDYSNTHLGLQGLVQRVSILYTGCEANAQIALVTISSNYEAIPNVDFSEVIRGGRCVASSVEEFRETIAIIQKDGIIRQVSNPYGIEGMLSQLSK